MRILIILVASMLFTPISKAEPSPMEQSFEGNPIIIINLTYEAGTGGGDSFSGEIEIELFLNWAPTTVSCILVFTGRLRKKCSRSKLLGRKAIGGNTCNER